MKKTKKRISVKEQLEYLDKLTTEHDTNEGIRLQKEHDERFCVWECNGFKGYKNKKKPKLK